MSEADDGSGWGCIPKDSRSMSHSYKAGYVWGGVDGRQTHLLQGPLHHSKQLFPEADLNSRACWDKYPSSVPLERPNLKSTAHGTLGVLEGFLWRHGQGGVLLSAANTAGVLDCGLCVVPQPPPAFFHSSRVLALGYGSSSAAKRNLRNWG